MSALLVAALTVACFAGYVAWMAQRWWKDEYYGHGMFIPMVSAYLVSRRTESLRDLARDRFAWGMPFIIVGLGLHLVASSADVNFPSGFGLILTIFGLVVWLWGWGAARALAFPVGFLVFMVPLGRLLVDRVGQPMQVLAARMGGHLAIMGGLPAHIEGTTIAVPGYTFTVEAACSGLKSVVALAALAALYAYLIEAVWWKRALIFLGSAPIAVAANAVRVTVALVMGKALGQAAAEGFVHAASGTLVFLLALLGLTALGGLLGCNRLRADA